MSNYNYNRTSNARDKKELETLNPKIIDEKIKSGKIGGIYCFFGDEEYMADYYIKKILDGFARDGESELDCAVFDSDNFDVDAFRDMIASYPIVSDYKIVIIKHADYIKFKSGEKEELIKTLTEYRDDIKDYACVIFKLKTLTETADKTEKSEKSGAKKTSGASLANFMKERADLFEFKENPPASLIKWLKKIAAYENIEISDENAEYILNRAEMKMYTLKSELDKLICFARAENRNIISKQDIDLLTPKKTELEAFELTNAILDKKYGKAVESLDKLKSLKEEPVVILGQIARHFSDLLPVSMAVSSGTADSFVISKKTGIHEYKVRLTANALKKYADPAGFINKSLNLCRECDLRLKSTSLSDYGLIENLLFGIAGL